MMLSRARCMLASNSLVLFVNITGNNGNTNHQHHLIITIILTNKCIESHPEIQPELTITENM